MKIYSLIVVKNEADIIRASLLDACRWSDKIIVIDNGSEDGTWEIVQELSKQHAAIIPFEQYTGGFRIGIRARAYHAFRHELTREDWWCVRLDADEFYPGDVRAFLRSVPRRYRTVKKESIDYVLTQEDIEALDFKQDFEQIRRQLTHHLPDKRRERRFMRHNPCYLWPERWRYPHPWGRVYPKPIEVEHYQYRSPAQMQRRYETRQAAKAEGCGSFKHEQGSSWKDYIAPSEVVLKSGRNTVKIINGKQVVKQFERPRGIKRLIYSWFRKSKARRSYEYALRLGDRTPAPIAYHESYRHGLITDSDYVCQLSVCTHTFKDLRNPNYPNRDHILKEIGRFTAKLHMQGILHADYSQGNILFEELTDGQIKIEIVDLNRLRFYRHIGLRQGCRNFERLNIDRHALEVMASAYADTRQMDNAECIKEVLNHRWNKR